MSPHWFGLLGLWSDRFSSPTCRLGRPTPPSSPWLVVKEPVVARVGRVLHLAAFRRAAASLAAVMPLRLQEVWGQGTQREAVLATSPRPAVVLKATEAALAVLKATEAAALADVGHLNLRRSLLATLTSVVVAARGDVAGVGVLRV